MGFFISGFCFIFYSINDLIILLPEIYKGACDMHKLFSWRVAMPAYA